MAVIEPLNIFGSSLLLLRVAEKRLIYFRLLKKLQMLGVEERVMRRTQLYAAITSDEDNNADGAFSVA
jgi:hypothetical protein